MKKKIKYIILIKKEINFQQYQIMEVENHSFKKLPHFSYLGSIPVANNNFIKVDIDTRLKKAITATMVCQIY